MKQILGISGWKYFEWTIYILFWMWYFSSINVDWTANWFDVSLRPNRPAPLLVFAFPIYFFANAFWLIPKYLNKETWLKYLFITACLFLIPEVLRILCYSFWLDKGDMTQQIFHRDSLIFGSPNMTFLAFNTSLLYRFAKNWFANPNQKNKNTGPDEAQNKIAYQNENILDKAEEKSLRAALEKIMLEDKPYLNSNLGLRELSDTLSTTEKKLSFLLNQRLHTNFYDYLNTQRVTAFKEQIVLEENSSLTTLGVAMNCGFSSKSSFYRAFKNIEGKSPSAYLKSLKAK